MPSRMAYYEITEEDRLLLERSLPRSIKFAVDDWFFRNNHVLPRDPKAREKLRKMIGKEVSEAVKERLGELL